MIENTQRKSGYLYQFNGGPEHPPVETWHRTFNGALRAKFKNRDRGSVYHLTCDDKSEKVA